MSAVAAATQAGRSHAEADDALAAANARLAAATAAYSGSASAHSQSAAHGHLAAAHGQTYGESESDALEQGLGSRLDRLERQLRERMRASERDEDGRRVARIEGRMGIKSAAGNNNNIINRGNSNSNSNGIVDNTQDASSAGAASSVNTGRKSSLPWVAANNNNTNQNINVAAAAAANAHVSAGGVPAPVSHPLAANSSNSNAHSGNATAGSHMHAHHMSNMPFHGVTASTIPHVPQPAHSHPAHGHPAHGQYNAAPSHPADYSSSSSGSAPSSGGDSGRRDTGRRDVDRGDLHVLSASEAEQRALKTQHYTGVPSTNSSIGSGSSGAQGAYYYGGSSAGNGAPNPNPDAYAHAHATVNGDGGGGGVKSILRAHSGLGGGGRSVLPTNTNTYASSSSSSSSSSDKASASSPVTATAPATGASTGANGKKVTVGGVIGPSNPKRALSKRSATAYKAGNGPASSAAAPTVAGLGAPSSSSSARGAELTGPTGSLGNAGYGDAAAAEERSTVDLWEAAFALPAQRGSHSSGAEAVKDLERYLAATREPQRFARPPQSVQSANAFRSKVTGFDYDAAQERVRVLAALGRELARGELASQAAVDSAFRTLGGAAQGAEDAEEEAELEAEITEARAHAAAQADAIVAQHGADVRARRRDEAIGAVVADAAASALKRINRATTSATAAASTAAANASAPAISAGTGAGGDAMGAAVGIATARAVEQAVSEALVTKPSLSGPKIDRTAQHPQQQAGLASSLPPQNASNELAPPAAANASAAVVGGRVGPLGLDPLLDPETSALATAADDARRLARMREQVLRRTQQLCRDPALLLEKEEARARAVAYDSGAAGAGISLARRAAGAAERGAALASARTAGAKPSAAASNAGPAVRKAGAKAGARVGANGKYAASASFSQILPIQPMYNLPSMPPALAFPAPAPPASAAAAVAEAGATADRRAAIAANARSNNANSDRLGKSVTRPTVRGGVIGTAGKNAGVTGINKSLSASVPPARSSGSNGTVLPSRVAKATVDAETGAVTLPAAAADSDGWTTTEPVLALRRPAGAHGPVIVTAPAPGPSLADHNLRVLLETLQTAVTARANGNGDSSGDSNGSGNGTDGGALAALAAAMAPGAAAASSSGGRGAVPTAASLAALGQTNPALLAQLTALYHPYARQFAPQAFDAEVDIDGPAPVNAAAGTALTVAPGSKAASAADCSCRECGGDDACANCTRARRVCADCSCELSRDSADSSGSNSGDSTARSFASDSDDSLCGDCSHNRTLARNGRHGKDHGRGHGKSGGKDGALARALAGLGVKGKGKGLDASMLDTSTSSDADGSDASGLSDGSSVANVTPRTAEVLQAVLDVARRDAAAAARAHGPGAAATREANTLVASLQGLLDDARRNGSNGNGDDDSASALRRAVDRSMALAGLGLGLDANNSLTGGAGNISMAAVGAAGLGFGSAVSRLGMLSPEALARLSDAELAAYVSRSAVVDGESAVDQEWQAVLALAEAERARRSQEEDEQRNRSLVEDAARVLSGSSTSSNVTVPRSALTASEEAEAARAAQLQAVVADTVTAAMAQHGRETAAAAAELKSVQDDLRAALAHLAAARADAAAQQPQSPGAAARATAEVVREALSAEFGKQAQALADKSAEMEALRAQLEAQSAAASAAQQEAVARLEEELAVLRASLAERRKLLSPGAKITARQRRAARATGSGDSDTDTTVVADAAGQSDAVGPAGAGSARWLSATGVRGLGRLGSASGDESTASRTTNSVPLDLDLSEGEVFVDRNGFPRIFAPDDSTHPFLELPADEAAALRAAAPDMFGLALSPGYKHQRKRGPGHGRGGDSDVDSVGTGSVTSAPSLDSVTVAAMRAAGFAMPAPRTPPRSGDRGGVGPARRRRQHSRARLDGDGNEYEDGDNEDGYGAGANDSYIDLTSAPMAHRGRGQRVRGSATGAGGGYGDRDRDWNNGGVPGGFTPRSEGEVSGRISPTTGRYVGRFVGRSRQATPRSEGELSGRVDHSGGHARGLTYGDESYADASNSYYGGGNNVSAMPPQPQQPQQQQHYHQRQGSGQGLGGMWAVPSPSASSSGSTNNYNNNYNYGNSNNAAQGRRPAGRWAENSMYTGSGVSEGEITGRVRYENNASVLSTSRYGNAGSNGVGNDTERSEEPPSVPDYYM